MDTEEELIKIGVGLLDTLKYSKAIEYFSKAIEINHANSETFQLRGLCWFRLYDIEKALSDISRAIELDPQNHSAWSYKADILKYKHEYAESETCYREALKMYPDSFAYLSGLSSVLFSLKKYDECITYCNLILNESPVFYSALFRRGVAYGRKRLYKEAIKDYLKIIETSNKISATVYNNLGYWYSKTGDVKKAYNNLSIALQVNPTDPYALDNMGHVFYLQGKLQKAVELINQSLEVDPSNSYAYKNRALVFLRQGKKDAARADLLKSQDLGYREDYGTEVDELMKANSF